MRNVKRHESPEASQSETGPSENFEPALRQRKTGWKKPNYVFAELKSQ